MKQTSYAEFVELAQRGTFVPVCKEIMADLLTPVSAFLKIAEHSDYAFLLESVEGGEQVARYSFLGKDPFLVVRSRDGKTLLERGGAITEDGESFMSAVRKLMADFHSPFVPGCHGSPVVPSVISATTRRAGLSLHCSVRGTNFPSRRATAMMRRGSCCLTRCSRSTTSSIES